MARTYQQLVDQIKSLQAEADRLKEQEMGDVVQRIRDAISHYGLTAADLGLGGARPGRKPGSGAGSAAAPSNADVFRKRRAPRGSAKKAAPAAAKYRNDAGQSWVGRGKRPQWLRDALAGGKTLQDFLIR